MYLFFYLGAPHKGIYVNKTRLLCENQKIFFRKFFYHAILDVKERLAKITRRNYKNLDTVILTFF